jgi:DNA repair exonuclease SbcCD ATPase subunit
VAKFSDKGIGIKVTLNTADMDRAREQMKELIDDLKKISEKNPIHITFDSQEIGLIMENIKSIQQMSKDVGFDNLKKDLEEALKISRQLEESANNIDKVTTRTDKKTGAHSRTVTSSSDDGYSSRSVITGTTAKGAEIDKTVESTNFAKMRRDEEKAEEEAEERAKQEYVRSETAKIKAIEERNKAQQRLEDEQEEREKKEYVRSMTSKMKEIEERNKLEEKAKEQQKKLMEQEEEEKEKQEQKEYVRSMTAKMKEIEERNKLEEKAKELRKKQQEELEEGREKQEQKEYVRSEMAKIKAIEDRTTAENNARKERERVLQEEQKTDRKLINDRLKDLQSLQKELAKLEEGFHGLQTQPNKKQADIDNLRNTINEAMTKTNSKDYSDNISGIAQQLEPLHRSLDYWVTKDNKELERRSNLYEQILRQQKLIQRTEIDELKATGEEKKTLEQQLTKMKADYENIKKQFNDAYNKDVAKELKDNNADHKLKVERERAKLRQAQIDADRKAEDEQEKHEQEAYVRSEMVKIKAIEDRNKAQQKADDEQEEREKQEYVRSMTAKMKEIEERNKAEENARKEKEKQDNKDAKQSERQLEYTTKVKNAISKYNEGLNTQAQDDMYKFAELSLYRQYELREKLLSAGRLESIEIRKQLVDEEKITKQILEQGTGEKNKTMLLRTEQVAQFKMLQQELNNGLQLKGQKVQDGGNTLATTLKSAFGNVAQWVIGGQVLMEIFGEIRSGVTFVNELNKGMTEIAIVTGKNKSQISELAKSYNDLAKQMSVTTNEITKASVEFYRQGLTDEQVKERMVTTTQYAKISSLDFEQASKILTATVNSMEVDITRASDVFSYLGDMTATGADELGIAFQEVGKIIAPLYSNI